MEGVIARSRIAVYSVGCGLTWDADAEFFLGEADLERFRYEGLLIEPLDKKARERLLSFKDRLLNGLSKPDFLGYFPDGGGSDVLNLRYVGGQSQRRTVTLPVVCQVYTRP